METSGLVARRDRVLAVAVGVLGPDGEQTDEFSTLLDPGCDPGPVHVHGLTAERLRGAPVFDQVAPRIAGMQRDRVLVAHNAQFDYDFLAHEFARAGAALPVARRLCTLALHRRVDPPTEDLRLGTLAAHYGVPPAQGTRRARRHPGAGGRAARLAAGGGAPRTAVAVRALRAVGQGYDRGLVALARGYGVDVSD